VTEADPQLAVVLLGSIFAAASAMVCLGLAKKRLTFREPYCRVCRARHRGACKIRLTL
jgi:hypothetical protein